MAAPGIVDPTKAGQYPVILSDALLGQPSNETYTGIRYNHRPALSSDTAPGTARLKKSARDDSYNLGFEDQGNKYQYNGVRTTDDGNYALIFDPVRKAFVLHRVDSTFHMNLTRTPTESNAEILREQFPHLEVRTAVPAKAPRGRGPQKAGAAKPTPTKAKAAAGATGDTPKTKGSGKPGKSQPVALTLPDLTAPSISSAYPPSQQTEKKPEPTAAQSQSELEKKAKRPALSPVESEEEDDDDGGLTVEYPGGNPSAFQNTRRFSPDFPVAVTRRFSEFALDMRKEPEEAKFDHRGAGGYEEEGYEEEDEYDEEEDEEPSRPSPSPARPSGVEHAAAVEPDRYTFDDGDEDTDGNGNDGMDQDLRDLEAELEMEFDKVQEEGHESDSSVSEEE